MLLFSLITLNYPPRLYPRSIREKSVAEIIRSIYIYGSLMSDMKHFCRIKIYLIKLISVNKEDIFVFMVFNIIMKHLKKVVFRYNRISLQSCLLICDIIDYLDLQF